MKVSDFRGFLYVIKNAVGQYAQDDNQEPKWGDFDSAFVWTEDVWLDKKLYKYLQPGEKSIVLNAKLETVAVN